MNLFSRIFKQNKIADIPIDVARRNYFLSSFGYNSVNWSNYIPTIQDNELLIQKYNELAEISAPVNKYAIPALSVYMEVYKKIGKRFVKIETTEPIAKEIDKFWSGNADKLMVYKKLLGNAYISKTKINSPLDGEKLIFDLLPAQYVTIQTRPKQKIDIRTYEVEKYKVDFGDTIHNILEIDANDVFHIKENNPLYRNQNYLYGISKLVSCGKNIKCIEGGYGAKSSLYTNGPRGIVTGKQQGEFASANIMSDETVKELQDRFNNRYGMQDGQFNWLFTDIPLDVSVISYNSQQLQINENNKTDVEKICAQLNVSPIAIFTTSDTTFTNVKEANYQFFTQSFKNEIDGIANQLTIGIQKTYPNYYIMPNYCNIPEIMEAQKMANSEKLENCKIGIITRNQYLEAIGEPTVSVPEFDMYATCNSSNQWTLLGDNNINTGQNGTI